MSEPLLSGGGPTSDPGLVCPWCSASLPAADVERCPACGAALREPEAAAVPGVTQIDVDAILKGRAPTPRPRGIIGWLAGEYEPETAEPPPPGTLEPPDVAVRREMLRLELAALEAEVLARQAEVVAEVATETGAPVELEDLGLGGPGEATTTASEAVESVDASAVEGSDGADESTDPGTGHGATGAADPTVPAADEAAADEAPADEAAAAADPATEDRPA